MSMPMEAPVTIALLQQDDYRFEASFDDLSLAPLLTDEATPLGSGLGPDPVQLLGVSVANCLCASLLFALRKFHLRGEPLRAYGTVRLARNAAQRLRIERIEVDLRMGAPASDPAKLERVLDQFEEFCTVTQSVRAAFPVDVRVLDRDGRQLRPRAARPVPASATPVH